MMIKYTIASVLFLSLLVSGGLVFAGELQPLYPGYPEVYDLKGVLDLKSEVDKRVVINDSSYTLRSTTTYHTPNGTTTLATFSARDQVGVLLVPKSMEVKSLWLLKAAKPEVKKSGEEGSAPTRQEDGVWVN